MTGATRPALAHAFRRAALPLGWYYAVTLGLPLANGAAQSDTAFVNHALVVIVVPPILIMLLCTIHRTAQVFADASRSACHSRTGHAGQTILGTQPTCESAGSDDIRDRPPNGTFCSPAPTGYRMFVLN